MLLFHIFVLLEDIDMKKCLFIIVLSIGLLNVEASVAQSFTWPIAGKAAGTDVLSRPQEYIEQEQNYDGLFIGGAEGDVVVCPTDGTILHLFVVFRQSMNNSLVSSWDPAKTFDENIRDTDLGKGTDPRYATVGLSLQLKDGSKIHIDGLQGEKRFKTGQRLAKGDTLGCLGYSYKAFKEPSLSVSISGRDNKPMDPMTPFGLKTTFVPFGGLTREDPMPAEKIREDLQVLEEAFCELYPSLEDRMPEAAFRAYMDSLRQAVAGPMNPGGPFRLILRQILNKLPDSHLYLYPDPVQAKLPKHAPSWPGLYLMWCEDSLRVLIAGQGYTQYEGKVVTSVDGQPASAYADRFDVFHYLYDGAVESTLAEERIQLGSSGSLMHWGEKRDHPLDYEFADGTHASVPFLKSVRDYRIGELYHRNFNWYARNRMRRPDDAFETRQLNDSVAFLALRTFDLNTVQEDSVRVFLAGCDAPNLVVDLRNNSGGDVTVLMRLLACLADKPMDRQKGGYNRVKKQGDFASLQYSLNYANVPDIFPDYEPREGEEGFFSLDTIETCSVVLPDPEIHYGGKIYVLTNGHSYSAATLFPAVLVRNRRGVSVGRETGTGYHYMTALKFADIRLPHTLQTIRIPMVQLVFDTTVCDRTPAGRGLLPDYPLPLSLNEVLDGPDGKTDVMLEYALSLIANGQYLSPKDPFAAADTPSPEPRTVGRWYLFAALALLLLAAAGWLLSRRS